MNFDATSYAIHRAEINTDRIRLIEQHVELVKHQQTQHDARLDALEAWKGKISGLLSRWPTIAGIGTLIALNWAPKETAKAIVAAVKALT